MIWRPWVHRLSQFKVILDVKDGHGGIIYVTHSVPSFQFCKYNSYFKVTLSRITVAQFVFTGAPNLGRWGKMGSNSL